jgi:hypothetical protein
MAVKVSQATIDKIKKMGMTKALAGAKSANPEMREALIRMYGAKRVGPAGGAKYSSADSARSANAPVRYKSPDAARSSATYKPSAVKTTTKTTTGKSATAAQKAAAEARAGGGYKYTTPSWTSTPKPKSTPATQPKATAAQIAYGKARAGGNVNFNPKPKPKVVETAAQKAAKEALKKKQRAAAAAAVKRAGRSM